MKWALKKGFNPRPPRRMGAMLSGDTVFSPFTGFNPRPPRRMGAMRSDRLLDAQQSVSILAHPEGWALFSYDKSFRLRIASFQSSPTPKDGRYEILFPLGWPEKVSILAHPEGWALCSDADRDTCGEPFQSSPTPKDGRYEQAFFWILEA